LAESSLKVQKAEIQGGAVVHVGRFSNKLFQGRLGVKRDDRMPAWKGHAGCAPP